MGVNKKSEKTQPEEKKVHREPHLVLFGKNFGKGYVQAGKTVELSKKAGIYYTDQGIVKPLK